MGEIFGLLTGKIHNADRTVSIPTKDNTFSSIDADVLVFWKGAFHRVRSAEIGDGMELVVGYSRKSYGETQLDNDYVRSGLSIYNEFDEDTKKTFIYLYGFPKNSDAITSLNNNLTMHDIGLQAERQGKFITLGAIGAVSKNTDHIDGLKSVQNTLSFLYGSFLGYGQWVGDDETIHHALINIPVIGSITNKLPIFEHILKTLNHNGIFIRSSYVDTNVGQILQLDIYDWEVLGCFAQWSDTKKTIIKYQQFCERSDQIEQFLHDTKRGDSNGTDITNSKKIYKFCKY